MAVTYSATRANAHASRNVFQPISGSTTDAVVIKTDDATSVSDVIAVARDYVTAQAIASAMNGV